MMKKLYFEVGMAFFVCVGKNGFRYLVREWDRKIRNLGMLNITNAVFKGNN